MSLELPHIIPNFYTAKDVKYGIECVKHQRDAILHARP